MSLPSVSIIMTPWRRTQLLRNTLDSIFKQRYPNLQIIVVEDNPSEASTELLCLQHKIEYAARRRHTEEWCNPAPLLNHAIRKATGDVLIFQNAECMYDSETGIADLVAPVAADPQVSTVALVKSLDSQGRFIQWYSHPADAERAGWISCFCQAVSREEILKIQGFDEIFTQYGQEDDLFEFRLRQNGIKFQYCENVLVFHQWHEKYHYTGVEQQGQVIREAKERAVLNGDEPNIANYGKDWGCL